MMESNIIIGSIIGLIIGAVIVFFIKSKSQVVNAFHDNNVNTIKKDTLQFNIESLEKEKLALENKLLESEKLLEIVQSSKSEITFNDSDKLLKEIKELKDEIEDLEDDLDDQNKSNKKLREEKFKIEKERDNIEKEKREIVEEKEGLKKEFILITDKFNEEKESLDFINEILNAQDSSDKDVEKLDEDTWEIHSFISTNIIDCFKNFDNESHENLEFYSWQWRNLELKPWLKNKKKIAIVGEFSAGKTSIINRIISQDNPKAPLLPVSSKETTAIPTYVSKSKDFNCQFYSPDEELRTIKKETFEMVTKSVLDKVNVSHLIKYFILSYDNQNLDDLSILDTPGFASNSDEIIKRTTDVVREVDALFWVIDANMGDINQTSLDVLKEELNDIPLYFIINKSDTKSPSELDQLREKIELTIKNNEVQYKEIICFSQKEDVNVLMKHIKEIKVIEQTPLMKYIADFLDDIINNLNREKEELRREREGNTKELNETKSGFKAIQKDIVFSTETIKKLVKEKETWFGLGDNKFQIDRADYADFQKHSGTIVNLSGEIKEHVDFHSKEINIKIKIDADFERNKYQLEYVRQVKNDFIRLLTNYNANLLN